MITRVLLVAGLLMQTGFAAAAQSGATPYAGMEQRSIKALSSAELADLRAGRGMGFALSAELNGYPGPLHALEWADELGLSETQRERTRALYEEMQRRAKGLGEELIEAERSLDEAFAKPNLSAEELAPLVREAARLRGELRLVHLRAHLTQTGLLSTKQIERYQHLRGYAGDDHGHRGGESEQGAHGRHHDAQGHPHGGQGRHRH